jgi:HD-GYP domain-containing protein (c-di-GMP phosphodiesterase class II)
VIRQHHERYDGRGYPDGSPGRRSPWPPDRALRHLEAERGAHFDPRCLDAFLALMAERGHRAGGRVDQAAPADASCH